MDALDCQITAMTAAHLSDQQILDLARVRMKYASEPTWPDPSPERLAFYRRLADAGRIGRGDRYASLTTLKTLPRWLDFASEGEQCCPPPYSG